MRESRSSSHLSIDYDLSINFNIENFKIIIITEL